MPNDTATVARNPDLIPKQHHLDRRAHDLAAHGAGDGHDLLSTIEVAIWLGVSPQFLEIGRHRGYGPRFVRLSPRRTRYLRSDVIEWLRSRSHASTAEYARHREVSDAAE